MNTANRALTVDDQMRAPFAYDRETGAKELSFSKDLKPAEMAEPKQRAADAILYFWDKFGFEPAREQVLQVVEELYHVLLEGRFERLVSIARRHPHQSGPVDPGRIAASPRTRCSSPWHCNQGGLPMNNL